jgi:hypothetical protein
MIKRIVISVLLLAFLVSPAWSADTKDKSRPKAKEPVVEKKKTQVTAPGSIESIELIKEKAIEETQVFNPEAVNIKWSSVNSGGVINAASASYGVNATTSQTATGVAANASYQAKAGFWYGAGAAGGAACSAIPGDANFSNTLTLGDAISIVNYIFNKPGFPPCASNSAICWLSDLLCRGDVNASQTATLGDVIQLVNRIFNKPCAPNPPGCWDPVPSPNSPCCLPVP